MTYYCHLLISGVRVNIATDIFCESVNVLQVAKMICDSRVSWTIEMAGTALLAGILAQWFEMLLLLLFIDTLIWSCMGFYLV